MNVRKFKKIPWHAITLYLTTVASSDEMEMKGQNIQTEATVEPQGMYHLAFAAITKFMYMQSTIWHATTKST